VPAEPGGVGAPISELPADTVLSYSDVFVNNDIIVLASPEIGGLPAPIVGLVAAGALAAALSTASGLLLVISSSVANDVYYKKINPQATEARQLLVGRCAMAAAIVVAGYLGINPIFGIAETGFGTIGMLINFAVTIVVSKFTTKPTAEMQELVEEIRFPGRTALVAKHADGGS